MVLGLAIAKLGDVPGGRDVAAGAILVVVGALGVVEGARCAGRPQRFERATAVAAHDELRRPLHEERDRLVGDDVLDAVRQLTHLIPLVLILSSWMVPSCSGSASASFTRRCWSSSESSSK